MPPIKPKDRSRRSRPALSLRNRWFATCGITLRRLGRQHAWSGWHETYQNNQHLKARLEEVRQTLRAVFDSRPPGRIRVISLCAGDGRDILEVLAKHARRNDIEVWLIDSDAASLARGEAAANQFGLHRHVHFRQADAAAGHSYVDIAPADVLLASGFIGRLTFGELAHFAAQLAGLCASGADFVWTRHYRGNQGMDISRVRELFSSRQFHEQKFTLTSTTGYAVAWQRFVGTPVSILSNMPLFDSRQLRDPWSGLSVEAQDSPIGPLVFNRGRWSTQYRHPALNLDIEILVTSIEREPAASEIDTIAGVLAILSKHISTFRRSHVLGWSYYPRRITAVGNGDIAVRYRSRLRFLPSKTQLIVREFPAKHA